MEESGSLYCQEESQKYNLNGDYADLDDHLIIGNDNQTGGIYISGAAEKESRVIFSTGETCGCC